MTEASQVGQVKKKRSRGKKRPPKFNRCMFEFACAPDSQTHKTFLELGIPHVPLSKEHLDLTNADMQDQLHNHLETCEEVPDLRQYPVPQVPHGKGSTGPKEVHDLPVFTHSRFVNPSAFSQSSKEAQGSSLAGGAL